MTMDERAVARTIAAGFQAWDAWSAESAQAHGARTLVRQETRRIARTLALLDARPAPRRLLEIGTGYLTLAAVLRRAFPAARLAGLEHPGRGYLWAPEYAKRLAMERIVVAAADLATDGLPFRARAFDAVVFAEVIEHLPPNAVPAVLVEIHRVLEPGGTLVLTTPNLASWGHRELLLRGHSPMQSPLRAIDGTSAHLRLYTMAELVTLLRAAGFVIDRRAVFDQVAVGVSLARRALRLAMAPARRLRPALRDTCAVRGLAVGPSAAWSTP